jgi:hypothetical protein
VSLIDRAKERWQTMTAQEREAFKRERAQKLQQLPADERARLLEQRRAMLEQTQPRRARGAARETPAR